MAGVLDGVVVASVVAPAAGASLAAAGAGGVPGGDGSGAPTSRAIFAVTAASAALAASVLVGLPEVATAATSVPATSSPVIAITSRSPRELVGKSGRRVPIPSDRPKAHTTSSAAHDVERGFALLGRQDWGQLQGQRVHVSARA